jgi:hypothetical protein
MFGLIWAKRGLAQRISRARFGLGPRARAVTRGAAARSVHTVGPLGPPREGERSAGRARACWWCLKFQIEFLVLPNLSQIALKPQNCTDILTVTKI